MWAPREVEIFLARPEMQKSVGKKQEFGLLLIFDLLLLSVLGCWCWIRAPTYICWPGQASGGDHMSSKTSHMWADGSAQLHTDILVLQPRASDLGFSILSAKHLNPVEPDGREFKPSKRTEGITVIKVSWSFWKRAKNTLHCLEFICCDFAIIRAWTFINYTEFIQSSQVIAAFQSFSWMIAIKEPLPFSGQEGVVWGNYCGVLVGWACLCLPLQHLDAVGNNRSDHGVYLCDSSSFCAVTGSKSKLIFLNWRHVWGLSPACSPICSGIFMVLL